MKEGLFAKIDRDAPVLQVSDLTRGIQRSLERSFSNVWVEGELSNYKRHVSGHCYFTLKDADAQICCVMWRSTAQQLFFTPQDGMLVRIRGSVSIYEVRGELQLVVRTMRPAGEGELLKAFEALKRRLAEEGLFDPDLKKPLPAYPETIGIVTSGSGAVLRDILSILARRFPQVRVLVCPVQVQGAGAAEDIAAAIDGFNLEADPAFRPDVLIIGRGGGSAEDLWAFNEEAVARSIFASAIPVISAVGHETDFSISDFAADVRAATPSMAAELAVPDRREVVDYLNGLCRHLRNTLLQAVALRRQRVQQIAGSYAFNRPRQRLEQAQQRLDGLHARLLRAGMLQLQQRQQVISGLQSRLQSLDPGGPLRRGYALIERRGKAVRDAAALHAGDTVAIRFRDGNQPAIILDPSIDE